MTPELCHAEEWLAKSPTTTHNAIEAYFAHVVWGRGVRDLGAIVAQVTVLAADRWSWTHPEGRSAYEDLLRVLRGDPEGARAYAQSIIEGGPRDA